MKNLGLIFLCLLCLQAKAQEVETRQSTVTEEIFAEKLVRIAWQNDPESEVVRRNVDVARYDTKLTGLEWLNIISFTGNLNEFNIDSERDVFNRSQFLPRYNLRASVTLGAFFTIPYATSRSKEQLMIAQSLVDDRKLFIRGEVLRLYNNFLMQEKIYRLQAEMALDAENNFKLNEQKFREGGITFEQYSTARSTYNTAQIAYYQAEASYKNAKLTLEELVGIRLENVE